MDIRLPTFYVMWKFLPGSDITGRESKIGKSVR